VFNFTNLFIFRATFSFLESKMKKILIIEDEENIAQAEKLILENDYEIKIASDGEAGWKMIKSFRPNLIVLDLMLPNRGGYDLSFNIRQDKDLKDIKILMVSALGQTIDKKKGVLVGADAYLTKPFEAEDLLDNVRKLLSE